MRPSGALWSLMEPLGAFWRLLEPYGAYKAVWSPMEPFGLKGLQVCWGSFAKHLKASREAPPLGLESNYWHHDAVSQGLIKALKGQIKPIRFFLKGFKDL